ncbi:MAG: HlyC/CorC family transporter [Planctomycetaceae bacterium]
MESIAPALIEPRLWITVGAILGLLLLAGLFSCAETALTAASRGKLRVWADKGSSGSKTALAVTDDDERMIGTLLLANNVVTILSAALATALCTRLFGISGIAIATVVMTVLVLVFGEVLPKTFAITMPEAVAIRVAPVIKVCVRLLGPLISLVQSLVRGILAVFGLRTDPAARVLALREELAGAIELGHSEGAMHKEDRDRLLGALDLSHRTVSEIMQHRSRIEMIDADLPPLEIIRLVLASSHTRLPLRRGDDREILGVIHAKELLRAMDRLLRDGTGDLSTLRDLDVLAVAMPPYFIPESTPLDAQMREFLDRRTHFALVVDEYGELQGLITLEDILEEIVGEITDEFDVGEQAPQRSADGDWLVDGATQVRTLNRLLDWNLPEDDATTVAGLVIRRAREIPDVGDAFELDGFRFEVASKEDNRIARLKIRPPTKLPGRSLH